MKRKNVMQFLSGLMIAAMVATSAVVIPENVEAATTATVTTQAQLDKALKSNVKKTVVIKTTKKQTLSVKAGTYSKITLKVDAPKVTLTNKGKFAKIQIVDAETVTDKKSGNSYSISDKKLTLSVAKGVKAAAVTYSGVNGTLTIKGEGAVKAFKISKAYGSVIKNSTKKKLVATNGNKKITVKAGSKKTIEDTTKVNDLSYAEYSLKWQDDFKGTKLNRDDWNVELHDPGWVNAELQAYVDSDANIEVKDGMLYLHPIQTKNADGTYSYTSGRVNTQGKHDFKYGLFEARVKVPAGTGYLPAFWMMPTDENLYGQWPKCGEIDCMEVMGQDTKKAHGTIHFGEPHSQSQGTYTLSDGSFSDEFHTFSCEWEPGSIKWYVDGHLYHTANDWYSTTDGIGTVSYPAPFDQPFYMILNLAVGGSWVGYPDDATFEAQPFVIDYVKAYQKDSYDEENVKQPVKEEATLKTPDKNGNYLTNGDFATAEDLEEAVDWQFMTQQEGEAKATIADNTMKVETTKDGVVDYSVQLVQAGLPLEKGATYRISFDAKADEARKANVAMKAPDRGWIAYMSENPEITTEFKNYSYEFTMDKDTDPNARFEYNMGATGSTATLYFKNIKLEKIKEADKSALEMKEVLADGNYIHNSKFQEGEKYLGDWEVTNKKKASVSVLNKNNDRKLKVVVKDAKSKDSDVVVAQTKLGYAAGTTYVLSFDAKADAARNMKVVVDGKTYKAKLSKNMKSYSFKVTADADTSNNSVKFYMGAKGTTYLDNVRLVEDSIIKNGDFSGGLTGFEVWADGSAEETHTVDSLNEKNALDFTINKSGDAEWKIQLKQKVKLEKDQAYRLSFDIKSSIDRGFQFAVQRDGSIHKDANGGEDWTPYVQQNETLKAYGADGAYTHISKAFKMTEDTDPASIFNIALGGGNIETQHRVCIDNIVLEKITEEELAAESVTDAKPVDVNLLTNAAFADDFNGWTETIANWDGSAEAERTIADGVLTYDIKKAGTEDWHVQLKNSGVQLEKGCTYKVSFDVSSSADRKIVSGVMHATNYSQYGQEYTDLKANEKKTVSYEFTVDNTDPAADFYISMGKVKEETPASVITLSNISVVKTK